MLRLSTVTTIENSLNRSRGVLGLALLLLVGCTTDPQDARQAVVVDSSGVRIVHHTLDHSATGWTIATEESVTLESEVDGRFLHEVTTAIALPDSRTLVVDAGNHRLIFYDRSGAAVQVFGREGEGPEEFQSLTVAGVGPADSLVVWDRRLRRASLFSPSGEFERVFRLETTDQVPFASVTGVFDDRSLLAAGYVDTGGPITTGRHAYQSPAFHFGQQGQLLAELGPMPITEGYFEVFENGGFTSRPVLFPTQSLRVPAGSRLVLASSDRYELRYLNPSGDTLQIIRREGKQLPVNESVKTTAIEAILSATAPEQRERVAEVLHEMPIPALLPEFDRMFADRLGRVWVEEYQVSPSPESDWRVYEEDGMLAGTISLPRALRPTDAGEDYILGVLESESEGEAIVRFVLAPEEPR